MTCLSLTVRDKQQETDNLLAQDSGYFIEDVSDCDMDKVDATTEKDDREDECLLEERVFRK